MALLEVHGLTRSFYGVQALSGLDLQVQAGTITALIGPNGAGKTTAFGCISGVVPPDGGRVLLDGADITGWRPDRMTRAGLTRTFQIARGIPRLSVIENLLLYAPDLPGERLLPALLGGGRRQARAALDQAGRWPGGWACCASPTRPPPRCRAGRRSCWRSAAR